MKIGIIGRPNAEDTTYTFKGYAKPSTKIGLFGWNAAHNLTHLKKDRERKPTIGLFKPDLSNDHESQLERKKIRLIAWTERTKDRAIEASGHRFLVSDRDGHPRGAFATLAEAEANADESDMVFDRIEGRNVTRRRERYDIPDPGVTDDEVEA